MRRACCGFLAVALAGALLTGCGSDAGQGPRTATELHVAASTIALPQGQRFALDAQVVDREGRPVPDQVIRYASSDTARVVVDTLGVLHSVGPMGQAVIRVSAAGLSLSVTVTITQRLVGYRLHPDSILANPHSVTRITLSQVDFVGTEFPVLFPIFFESGDTTIAGIDDAGQVSIRNAGTTTITVAFDTLYRVVPVTVRQLVGRLVVQPDSVRLQPGDNYQLSVVVLDQVGTPIANPDVTVTVSPQDAFRVSDNGSIGTDPSTGPLVARVSVRVDTLSAVIPVFVGRSRGMQPVGRIGMPGAAYGAATGPGGWVGVTVPQAGVAAFGILPDLDLPLRNPTPGGFGIRFGPLSGRLYLTVDAGLLVLNPSTTAVVQTIPFGGANKYSVVVSPDESLAWVGSDRRLYRVDLAGGRVLDSIAVPNATFLALDASGTALYQCDDVLREFDPGSLAVRRALPGGRLKKGIALSPDGTELYAADELGQALLVYRIADGALLETAPLGSTPFDVAVAGDRIAVSTASGVTILDRVTRFPLSTSLLGGTPRRLAFTPDGLTLVVANQAGWVDFLR